MYSCRQRQQHGKNWSMGCDIMCGAWALKVEFHWRKGKQKNWKIINKQRFLTFYFTSLLLFNNGEQAAAVWAKIGLWAVISCVVHWHWNEPFHWKNGEQKNWKIINTQCFLTLLFMLLLQFNNSEQAAEAEGQKSVCGLQYYVWHTGTKNSNFIEKRWAEELKNNQHSLLSHHSFCVTAAFL